MQKLFILLFLVFGSQWLIAQDDTQPSPAPDNPINHFEDLIKQFDLNGQGGTFFMDTMMIKQFGDLGINSQDFEQSMQEMIKQLEQQFQNLDFEGLQGFDQLFDGFDLDGLDLEGFPPLQDGQVPAEPGQEGEKELKKSKKKNKTYKL